MKRTHLNSKLQPLEGWRVIPFNGYYEAHPSGLVRNKKTKKLIKGTMTHKNDRFTGHEIVYMLIPKKTSYTRARIIATTFPEMISQSRGDLRSGHVCFKDGNRNNCHVNNLFIGKGKVNKFIYKMNGSYVTNKDIVYEVDILAKEKVGKTLVSLIRGGRDSMVTKTGVSIEKSDNVFSIKRPDRGLITFALDYNKIKED